MADSPSRRAVDGVSATGDTPAAHADPPLPVDSLRDAIPHLRRPFAPEAVKFKVQTVFSGNSGCLVVAYIDARLVIERLNAVCPHLWQPTFHETPKDKLLLCRLTIDGVTREDVGESPKGLSKDLYSDAFKRAAVHFGVGVSIYSLPQIPLYMREAHGRIELRGKTKPTIALTEHGHSKLREGYAGWLERHGEANFGPVLSHGDVEGATIDEEAETGEEFVPEAPPALDDERAKGLVEEARSVYREISELGDGAGRRALPPERFNAWKAGAAHSHEELERLVAHLKNRRDEIAEQLAGAAA